MARRTATLLLFLIPLALMAQPSVAPPALGYFFDPDAGTIHPLTGVPGAGLLEGPLALGAFERAFISPNGRFAIVNAGDQAAALKWDGTATPIDTGAARVEFSPSGTAAVLASEGRLRVWTGLPDRAELAREIAVYGEIQALAVSDDGSTVAWAAEGGLMLSDSDGARMLAPGSEWTSIAFRRASSDLAAAGRSANQVILTRDGLAVPIAGPAQGIASPVGLAFTLDNRRLVAANAGSGTVTVLDPETGESSETPCACQPDGLYRLRGNAVFRLVNSRKTAMAVFDGDGATPRIVEIAGGEQ